MFKTLDPPVWRTRGNEEIALPDITDSHLEACVISLKSRLAMVRDPLKIKDCQDGLLVLEVERKKRYEGTPLSTTCRGRAIELLQRAENSAAGYNAVISIISEMMGREREAIPIQKQPDNGRIKLSL